MTIALIVNRSAGHDRAARIEQYVKDKLDAAGVEYIDIIERGVDAAVERMRNHAGGVDAIFAAGGDGTVHYAAQMAWQYGVPLGIIPAGSGDDIARGAGLPHGRDLRDVQRSVDHLVEAWVAQDITALDGAIVTTEKGDSRLVLAVVSCGFDSRVSIVGARIKFPRGTMRYVWSMLLTLGQFEPISYRLEVDGNSREFRGMLMDIANAPTYGGGMRLSPDSKMNDGQLELLTLDQVGIPTLLGLFAKIFKGTHINHPKITVENVKQVRLHAEGEQVWGDGEYVGHCPVTVRMAPSVIRIVGARV